MAYKDHIVGQILCEHLTEGELIPGTEIGIWIDQTITQDATGTLVYLEFMSLGVDQVQTKCSASWVGTGRRVYYPCTHTNHRPENSYL
jgi:hypothetical protein